MSLFTIEQVNSLYDYFKDNDTFPHDVLLGFGAKIPRNTHIRVAWGDGELTEGSGEFDADQTIYVEGWVFDADGNKRYETYTALAVLIRQMVEGLFLWRDAHPELEIAISLQNHGDAYAPMYGVQLSVVVSSNHICRIVKEL